MFGNFWCKPGQKPSFSQPCSPHVVGSPAGGQFPFSNSAEPFIGPTPTSPPGPSPLIPACFDTLTIIPFSVPASGVIVPVSGGGNALAIAVAAASTGDTLLITDSLNYNAITLTSKTNLTIKADVGQTPSITAVAGNLNSCVKFGNGNNGIALLGLTFIGAGNATIFNNINKSQQGLVNCPNTVTDLHRLIIEDCTFVEPQPTVTTGAPGIQLIGSNGSQHQDVWIHRCTFVDTCCSLVAANQSGYGALTIGGFSNVYIQNCEVTRLDAVIARNISPMRGVVLKVSAGVVEDVLINDIGVGASNQPFYQPSSATFGSVVGETEYRNCVAFNTKSSFSIELAGAVMDIENCVYYCPTAGTTTTAISSNPAGTIIFRNSVSAGAGDGVAFSTLGNITEDHNDIYNFGSTGITLDPTDPTIDPLFQGVANGDFVATATLLRTSSSTGGPVGVVYPGGEHIIWCEN